MLIQKKKSFMIKIKDDLYAIDKIIKIEIYFKKKMWNWSFFQIYYDKFLYFAEKIYMKEENDCLMDFNVWRVSWVFSFFYAENEGLANIKSSICLSKIKYPLSISALFYAKNIFTDEQRGFVVKEELQTCIISNIKNEWLDLFVFLGKTILDTTEFS